MAQRGLWVRWSWRDLRQRWVQVTAIALVIALGTGTYAALMSTTAWRQMSNDASFARLHFHDLRVSLSEGSAVPEGTLAALARGIPHAADLTGIRERLVVATQVETAHGSVLVPGEIVGSALGPRTAVDTVSTTAGRSLTVRDDGSAAVVAEMQFATKNKLPTTGSLTLSGGVPVRYVGQGQSPEYFIVSSKQGALPFLSQKSYAVLFTSLHSAQAITGSGAVVNDLVVTTRPGTAGLVRGELRRAIAASPVPLSATVSGRRDVDSFRILYDDIKGDEELWRIIALLVLSGAAFAAINLTSRIVEAQRREIGIGMALGVRPGVLAIRPLLFGAQIAVIGVLLGIVVGWLVGIPLRQVFTDMLPLPIWRTPFQPGSFAQAALLGFVLPFAAVAWPIWRAVRVQPVDAIRVGHLAARSKGLARLLRRLPLPGRSYRHIPVRNVLRTPRRTLLTLLGIGAAITTLVTIVGFLDSFSATLDNSANELLHTSADRVLVSLRAPQPVAGRAVAAVRRLPEVAAISPTLRVPAVGRHGSRSLDLLAEMIPPGAPWRPTVVSGSAAGGIVLARKAAADLHVGVGDTIELKHPQAAAGGMRTVVTRVRVAGLHPDPMRVFAYLEPAAARMFGMAGSTNLLIVLPSDGVSSLALRRALLAVPEVASAETVTAMTEGMRSSLNEYTGILRVAGGVTLLLALLIGFNTASIGMDERSREHATMMAFGLPARTVLTMAMTETGIIAATATGLGIVGGFGLLSWLTVTTAAKVLPEIDVVASLAPGTLVVAFGLGVAVVTLAPLLTARRLRRMDVPSMLRVVE